MVAVFIIVVDRSGSMQGTPWKQEQGERVDELRCRFQTPLRHLQGQDRGCLQGLLRLLHDGWGGHGEQFLESLTFLGTSDGTYSFVSPSEGGEAIEERLVALVQSTSSAVGRSLNIEMKSNDLQFLGDTFGEGKAEVVVPAMVSKNNGVVGIATKKFVKKMPTCKGSPKLELKIYEKLTGAPKAIEAKIVTLEEVVLTDPTEVADHNLKKLRTALNMITGQISEADKPEQVE